MKLWLPAAILAVGLTGAASAQQRVDQLGVGAAISDSDTFPDCQGCSSVVPLVSVPASAINTYIASKGYALGSGLTANRLVLGAGGASLSVLGSLGTTTTVLHGNAAGPPSFGAVDLATDITGNLPVSRLDSGTNASNTTVWWGDGTWRALPPAVLPSIANAHVLGNATGFPTVATDTVLAGGSGIMVSAAGGTITIASSGTGGVAGPGSSVNTDLACWNGTGGNILSDCGVLIANIGTVRSVNFAGPGGIFSTSGWPITTTGTGSLSTAGTSGGIPYFSSASVLSSSGVLGANLPVFGGGAGATPIAGTRSGTTTEVMTGTGVFVAGNALVSDANGNAIDGGVPPGGGGGSGTVTSSPAGQIAYYGSTGTTVIGNANLNISAGALTVGIAGSVLGQLKVAGNTSGTITIQPQAAAGTYNFNLPITAGASGAPLLSGGGGSTAMSFGTLTGNTSKFATSTGTLTSGDVASWDASGNVIDAGILASAVTTASNAQTLTNKSISASQITSGTLAAARLPLASSIAVGGVQGDGSTLSINGSGVISCTTATSSQIGCARPDNTTLTVSAGVLSVPAPSIANGHIWANATGGAASPRDTTLAAGSGITIVAAAGTITLSSSGAGGVSGPGSSVNNDLACWNGTGGNALSDCGILSTTVTTATNTQTLTNKSISASQINSGTLAAARMLPLSNGAVYQGNGSSQPVSVTLSAAIDAAIGSTRGAILTRQASTWNLLAPGTVGFVLTSNGAGADLSYQAGGGGGGAVSVTASTADILVSPTPGTGTFTVGTTNIFQDRSTANAAISSTDAGKTVKLGNHTYTLAQAGTGGFGSGWGACLLNIAGSGNATVTTTTSIFQGAGNSTSLTLAPGAWACPGSDGTNYVTARS